MNDMIDVNQLSNALQQKVDLPSGKSQADIDYVVEWQAPTSANNYTWYRKYKSGWVEQGGYISSATNNTQPNINLVVNFADTSYSVLTTENVMRHFVAVIGKTTSTFQVYITDISNNVDTGFYWEAKGFAAQS